MNNRKNDIKNIGESKMKNRNCSHSDKTNKTSNTVSNNSILEAYGKTKKRYKHTLEELAK